MFMVLLEAQGETSEANTYSLGSVSFELWGTEGVNAFNANPWAIVSIRASCGLSIKAKCYHATGRCELMLTSSCCGSTFYSNEEQGLYCGSCRRFATQQCNFDTKVGVGSLHYRWTVGQWVGLEVSHELERGLITLELLARLDEWAKQVAAHDILQRRTLLRRSFPKVTKKFQLSCRQASGEL